MAQPAGAALFVQFVPHHAEPGDQVDAQATGLAIATGPATLLYLVPPRVETKTLGNGSVYSGFSGNFFGVTPGTLVLASNIPASGQTVANAQICAANSLDSALAAGKIV